MSKNTAIAKSIITTPAQLADIKAQYLIDNLDRFGKEYQSTVKKDIEAIHIGEMYYYGNSHLIIVIVDNITGTKGNKKNPRGTYHAHFRQWDTDEQKWDDELQISLLKEFSDGIRHPALSKHPIEIYKEAEKKEEVDFKKLVKGEVFKAVKKMPTDDAIDIAVNTWKVDLKWKRAIKHDDQKALRMIVKTLSK